MQHPPLRLDGSHRRARRPGKRARPRCGPVGPPCDRVWPSALWPRNRRAELRLWVGWVTSIQWPAVARAAFRGGRPGCFLKVGFGDFGTACATPSYVCSALGPVTPNVALRAPEYPFMAVQRSPRRSASLDHDRQQRVDSAIKRLLWGPSLCGRSWPVSDLLATLGPSISGFHTASTLKRHSSGRKPIVPRISLSPTDASLATPRVLMRARPLHVFGMQTGALYSLSCWMEPA